VTRCPRVERYCRANALISPVRSRCVSARSIALLCFAGRVVSRFGVFVRSSVRRSPFGEKTNKRKGPPTTGKTLETVRHRTMSVVRVTSSCGRYRVSSTCHFTVDTTVETKKKQRQVALFPAMICSLDSYVIAYADVYACVSVSVSFSVCICVSCRAAAT
jgi:hypothetical protein